MAMKLNTGKIAFPIEFDNGDIQNIYFNPSDPELGTRLIKAKDIISSRIEKIGTDNFELSNDGEPVDFKSLEDTQNLTDEQMDNLIKKSEKFSEVFGKTKQIIFEELNNAFGSDISSVVFKYCSPFAIVDGNYYVLNFLEAIAPEIKKYINKANKEVEKKMQKHLGKYIK